MRISIFGFNIIIDLLTFILSDANFELCILGVTIHKMGEDKDLYWTGSVLNIEKHDAISIEGEEEEIPSELHVTALFCPLYRRVG